MNRNRPNRNDAAKLRLQASHNHDKYTKRRAAAKTSIMWLTSFAALTMCVIGGHNYVMQWEMEEHRKILREIRQEEVDPMTMEWEEKELKLREEKARLEKKVRELEKPLHVVDQLRKGPKDKPDEDMITLKRKMQNDIQDVSKRALLEKFGPGPHRVQIQLDFDPQQSDRFVIEMAPVEEMPHAVYWFLEQVSHELYNGCSFHRNAGHVIQAGPAPNFRTPKGTNLMRPFKEAGFHSVKFQEYSPNFPHAKYTLGFAGRPGGPDFYVSTKDNTKVHGPGGQRSYADPTEADPCFAKVVEGFEVIDRILGLPVADTGYRHLKNNVAIRYMKIIDEL